MDELMASRRTRVHSHGASARTSGGGILCPSRLLRRQRHGASGFTLIETMFAMGILAIGILGVAGSLLTSLKLSRDSRSQTHAMYLAEQQMELFLLMRGDEIDAVLADPGYPNDPAGTIDPDPNDDDDMTFTRSWEILPDDPEPGVFRLTVIVGFTDDQGTPRTRRLQSLKRDF